MTWLGGYLALLVAAAAPAEAATIAVERDVPTRAPPPPAAVPAPAEDLVDEILPCGLRLVVARDPSLPVAAVAVVLPLGPARDPQDRPGWSTQLAYQLLEGNRHMPPGGWAAFAHDAGGTATLAQSWGRTRFEMVVPRAVLDDALDLAASIFEAPTVTPATATRAQALAATARRRSMASKVPAAVRAAVHGIRTPPRSPPERTEGFDEAALSRIREDLAREVRPDRAVLVLVTDLPIDDAAAAARRAFSTLPPVATLPQRAEPAPARQPPPTRIDADTDGWTWVVGAVPTDRTSIEVARILCRTVNRLPKGKAAERRVAMACHLDEDPDYPVLLVRTKGVVPRKAPAAVAERLHAIARGTLAHTVAERQRRIVHAGLSADASMAIGLVRLLATRPFGAPPPAGLDDAVGLARLSDPEAVGRAAEALLRRTTWSFVPARIRPRGRKGGARSPASPAPKPAHRRPGGRRTKPLPTDRGGKEIP